MHSSASSSIIVSNTGETGSLFGQIRRAGATSIQELKYLTPFAIVVINRIVLLIHTNFQPNQGNRETLVMKMNMIVRREYSSFAGEVRTKTECKRGS